MHFSKHGIHGLGTPKTRGAFEDELTVNEVIKNNEDTESTWKMTLPSLWRFLTRLVRNSSDTNEAVFQKLNEPSDHSAPSHFAEFASSPSAEF